MPVASRKPMMAPALAYIHRFEPGGDPSLPPVLLLHGTGGDETDLLPLGREIAPGAALLSPRGNVLEGDMPRFFKRFREGLFDEDDVRRRANELAISSPRRAASTASLNRWRSAIRTARTSLPPFCCCIRRPLQAPSSCAPRRRWPNRRGPIFPAFRS